MRPRYVPPELANDERLEECTELAALLYYRLVTLADDQGRLPGTARQIRGLAFAMRPAITERKVAGALEELVGANLVVVYDEVGRAYAQIREWWSLQGSPRRSYPSRYPAPPGWTDQIRGLEDVTLGDGGVPADSRHTAGVVRPPRAPTPSEAELSHTHELSLVLGRSGAKDPARHPTTNGTAHPPTSGRGGPPKTPGEVMAEEGGFAATLVAPTDPPVETIGEASADA